MNILKDLKAWFTKEEGGTTALNVKVSIDAIESSLQWKVSYSLGMEIVDRIATRYIEENAEKIRKEIIDNPKFADAVYNAIVLKKADKI